MKFQNCNTISFSSSSSHKPVERASCGPGPPLKQLRSYSVENTNSNFASSQLARARQRSVSGNVSSKKTPVRRVDDEALKRSRLHNSQWVYEHMKFVYLFYILLIMSFLSEHFQFICLNKGKSIYFLIELTTLKFLNRCINTLRFCSLGEIVFFFSDLKVKCFSFVRNVFCSTIC